jgi:hypothetical protein
MDKDPRDLPKEVAAPAPPPDERALDRRDLELAHQIIVAGAQALLSRRNENEIVRISTLLAGLVDSQAFLHLLRKTKRQ